MSFMQVGGSFMWPMMILGIVGVGVLVYAAIGAFRPEPPPKAVQAVSFVRHIAIFLLVMGVLSQAMGLYQAMATIESVGGGVSPALLAGGLKVSFVAPIFGLVEFLVLFAGYVVVRAKLPQSH